MYDVTVQTPDGVVCVCDVTVQTPDGVVYMTLLFRHQTEWCV